MAIASLLCCPYRMLASRTSSRSEASHKALEPFLLPFIHQGTWNGDSAKLAQAGTFSSVTVLSPTNTTACRLRPAGGRPRS